MGSDALVAHPSSAARKVAWLGPDPIGLTSNVMRAAGEVGAANLIDQFNPLTCGQAAQR